MMKWTLVGKLIDVGDLPSGRGCVMEVGGKSVTVTGLDHSMVQWLAKSYGKNIGLGFDSNEELKRLSAGSSPETKSAPHCCHEWVLMKGSMSSAGYRYVDRCKLCGEKRERTAPLEPGDSTFLEQFLNRGPSL